MGSRPRSQSKRGFILLVVMVVIGALALAGAVAVEQSTTDVGISGNFRQGEIAFLAAEAGLYKAMADVDRSEPALLRECPVLTVAEGSLQRCPYPTAAYPDDTGTAPPTGYEDMQNLGSAYVSRVMLRDDGPAPAGMDATKYTTYLIELSSIGAVGNALGGPNGAERGVALGLRKWAKKSNEF